jgi:hypothetical protein
MAAQLVLIRPQEPLAVACTTAVAVASAYDGLMLPPLP